MGERALQRLCATREVTVEVVRLAREAPGLRQAAIVAQFLEHCAGPLGDTE